MMVIKAKSCFRLLLGIAVIRDFAGTVGELFLCYVKTITFTFQRVDSSAACLGGLMQSAISPAARWPPRGASRCQVFFKQCSFSRSGFPSYVQSNDFSPLQPE